jgi:hypothetical protein
MNEGFVNTSTLFTCILIHCTYVQSRTQVLASGMIFTTNTFLFTQLSSDY